MEKYYLVNVEFRDVNEKGKVSKRREQYLALTTGCLEAEGVVNRQLVQEGGNLDFKITQVKETKIYKVL